MAMVSTVLQTTLETDLKNKIKSKFQSVGLYFTAKEGEESKSEDFIDALSKAVADAVANDVIGFIQTSATVDPATWTVK